jgi:mRNA-degrading endonuclease RelE of RelBE toxin-antitoxin system
MVKEIIESDNFKKIFKKLDKNIKDQIKKIIRKIIENPEIGKPMRYERKRTRELYISPFRFSYAYDSSKDIIYLLDLYHKKKQ